MPAPGATLDERGPGAAAGAVDGFLGYAPDGDQGVAVNSDAGEAVGLGTVAQVLIGLNRAGAIGMRLFTVLDHDDDGEALTGGQAGRFMPEAERGETVVGERDYAVGCGEVSVGPRDSSGG